MTILVCQECEKTIDDMIDEKISTLYGKCPNRETKNRVQRVSP